MNIQPLFAAALILALMLFTGTAFGQPSGEPQASQPLTVAVLSFDADFPGEPQLGSQLAEALGIMLTVEPSIQLVDRATLEQSLREQELSLTGLVDAEHAVQIGRLVGAKIIITGRVFRLGEQLFVTAKIVGTETTLVEGVILREDIAADLGTLVPALADGITEKLREKGASLVAQSDLATDRLERIKQALAGAATPVFAVVVREELLRDTPAPAPPTPDPAVETEIKKLLIEAGITVKDVPENELANFVRHWQQQGQGAWPRSLNGVDRVVIGEAFSESGSRIGNLVSAVARAEINVIDRVDGRIVRADRITTRAVDLSQQIAGKLALQNAGKRLAIDLLDQLATEAAD